MTTSKLNCFKANDIRGRIDHDLNEEIVYRIGRAYGIFIGVNKTVVVGADVRLSSEAFKKALIEGLRDSSVHVIDLGVAGTEEVYFSTFYWKVDGGIEVTASHNPLDYNGLKLVREDARPINEDNGLKEIQAIAEQDKFAESASRGSYCKRSCLADYTDYLLGYIDAKSIRPLKLVTNAGNGAAGHMIDALQMAFQKRNIPIIFTKIYNNEDGNFPHGIPNPLLPEKRADTSSAVLKYQADFGVAWDGDFDRCFLFDENGQFIEGYYIVGLLAEYFLKSAGAQTIIYDPRLIWNTIDVVDSAGGKAIQSKTGHAFIKESMREEDAIYGGEMSGHHYFRDFAYCDSGMIPWLLVIQLMSKSSTPLSKLIEQRVDKFPCSGEINFVVNDAASCMDKVKKVYCTQHPVNVDMTDGLSMSFVDWRFNIRSSNTEPVLRLNIESRNDESLVNKRVQEITGIINATN